MTAPLRPLDFGRLDVRMERRADGAILVSPLATLPPYPRVLTERLLHWASVAPARTFVAERGPDGAWIEVSYAETLRRVRTIGAALLRRGLNAERPVAILSGNSTDHLMLALAALHVGIPHCAISPPYSLVSKDFSKLRHAMALLTPGLVYAGDGVAFGRAIAAAVPADTELVIGRNPPSERRSTAFSDLLAATPGAEVEQAHAAIKPDDVAKFLLTSGSTGEPKAVITTHRMLTANQVQLREVLRFLIDDPPVIVDWLPWNHVFGGSHNTGLVLYNGGTMYLDDGRPLPGPGIAATVRNLMDIAPTVYFNVPKGFEMLVPHLERDAALREKFFSRLHCYFFAGAGLSAHVWGALDALAVKQTGARLPMLTGLGATESAPFALSATPQNSRSGMVGLPAPGVELKLVPVAGKLEARLKGPNLTPGYWRRPELTAKAYDEEGWYRLGDALKFDDPGDITKGLLFDGRITEDFKLATGTWVSVGPLRAALIGACAPLVRDVVVAGINRDDIALIVIADPDGCRSVAPDLGDSPSMAAIAAHAGLRSLLAERLRAFNANATGSSSRVAAALFLPELPSIDVGEVTDKGSINQRAVLEHRAALVEALYADPPPPAVLRVA
jgi:feruloyl-CoA synthase